MAFRKTFLISDESVNTYGFWIRTAGIKLDNAKNNCPAFYNHETWAVPLGHWENLRIDGDKLLGDLVIEGANETEKEYIRKIQNGDIKGCSLGADPMQWSNDVMWLKDGAPCLYECELFEGSLAPLNGNKNALALKSKDGFITLSDSNKQNFIPDFKPEFDMKQIALKLGLHENASEAEIIAAIVQLSAKANDAEVMRKHIESTVELNDEQKKLFVELSKTNIAVALQFVQLSKPAKVETPASENTTETPAAPVQKTVKVTDLIQKGANLKKEDADETKETFDYLQKHNAVELARIRKDEPEKYTQLAKDYQNGVRYKG